MSPVRDIEPFLSSQVRAFFFCSFLSFCFFPSSTAADSPEDSACSPKSCNGILVHYPFSLSASTAGTSCGFPGLDLTCQVDNADARLFLITPTGLNLTVKSINYTMQTIKLAIDSSLLVVKNECRLPSRNITLSDITDNDGQPILSVAANYSMGTFYGCSTKPSFTGAPDYNNGDTQSYNFTSDLVSGCSNPSSGFYSYAFSDDSFNNSFASWSSCLATLTFPVSVSSFSNDAGNVATSLSEGFDMLWTVYSMSDCAGCTASGGRCGYNTTGDHFLCFYRDHPGKVGRIKVIAGLSAAVASFLLACLFFFITRRLWSSSSRSSPAENGCLRLHTPTKVEKFLIDYETGATTRYTYNDIMKMTNKFKYKLGQGGYGSVFKGWLSNGTPVAVKLMEKSYNDGEEFCNGVATIGRIHHVNVVRLLGFCVQGSRRALVYDFMENGSLEKFTDTTTSGRCLLRERLYDMALGIARGIEYLHQGCDRRIIHFDIKPHNILLDHDFTPKISDFGLAKSYCKERNSVTLTDGKGTIGYIAPEIFYGNSKHVSHKTDVYSFGMLLIAMIGMKEKFGPTDGASSEAYFPHWIHATLSKNQKFEGIGEGQDEIIRKIVTIALWCIQWNAIDRPCMKEVVRMFESSTSSLTMPPNQFFPVVEPQSLIQVVDSSSTSDCSGLLV